MPSDYREKKTPAEVTEGKTTSADKGLSDAGIWAMQGPPETEGKKPLNSESAGQVYSFKGKDPELNAKYPEGVQFDAKGYPDFSPYAEKVVEIDMKGNYTTDFADANAGVGLSETPEGLTWHHHQDCRTMLLVPTDLHTVVRHTGGCAIIKEQKELKHVG